VNRLFGFLALIALLLGGCTPEGSEDHTEEPMAPAEDLEQEEEEFLETMAFDPYWERQVKHRPSETVREGRDVCNKLSDGDTILTIVEEVRREIADLVSAEHLVEAAVFTFCPEYISNFEAYLESNSP